MPCFLWCIVVVVCVFIIVGDLLEWSGQHRRAPLAPGSLASYAPATLTALRAWSRARAASAEHAQQPMQAGRSHLASHDDATGAAEATAVLVPAAVVPSCVLFGPSLSS